MDHGTARPPATTPAQRPRPEPRPATEEEDGALVADDMLVEEVSIDGMCGVY